MHLPSGLQVLITGLLVTKPKYSRKKNKNKKALEFEGGKF